MAQEVDFLSPGGSEGAKKEEHAAKKKQPAHKGVRVNLVTREILKATRERMERKNVRKLGLSVVAALGCAALLYGGTLIYGQLLRNELIPLSKDLKEINAQIGTVEKKSKELIAFQSKLTAIKGLFDEHIYWTHFFKNLEETTLPEVLYTNISIAPNMTISLNGAATNYTTLGRQYLAFQRATSFVKSAEITGAAAVLDSEGRISGVNFSMSLELKPESLKKQPSKK